MKKMIIIIALVVVLLAIVVQSDLYYQTDYGDSSSGGGSWDVEGEGTQHTEDIIWYDVPSWIIHQCKTWAGTASPINANAGETGTVGASSSLYQTSFMIQAQKTTLNEEEGLHYYELSWYIEPVEQDVTYSIFVLDENGYEEELHTFISQVQIGDSGYDAFESDVIYANARISFRSGGESYGIATGCEEFDEDNQDGNCLTVPFVEKDEDYYGFYD